MSYFSPVGMYLFKVNNSNTRTIYSKLTKKTTERRQLRCSGVSIANFKKILHIVLMFLLLTLNKKMPAGLVKNIFELILCSPCGSALEQWLSKIQNFGYCTEVYSEPSQISKMEIFAQTVFAKSKFQMFD